MSMTDPPRAREMATDVRGTTSDSFPVQERRETRRAYETTELWLTLLGVAALFVVYNYTDEPTMTLFRACLMATILGAAYIVSRGFAKAGSSEEEWRLHRRR